MQLTLRNLPGYLLDRRLISADELLEGRLMWNQLPARNNVLVVRNLTGKGLYLKQLRSNDKESLRLLRMEAMVQHVLHNFSDFDNAREFIPTYIGHDARQQVLISEYLHNPINLLEFTEQQEYLAPSHARLMAQILAGIHINLGDRISQDPSLDYLDQRLPWILNFPHSKEHAREEVFQHIKQNEFLLYRLDEVALTWQCCSIIHGDVKLQNFIGISGNELEALKLTDWELANIGDPLWDLAGLMQSYIACGLAYMTSTAEQYELPASKAFWKRQQVMAVWQVIWEAYSQHRNWNQKEEEAAAEKTVGFVAARLLQSAAELNRVRPEFMAPGAWSMIAEATAIFKKPHLFIRQFFQSTKTVHNV